MCKMVTGPPFEVILPETTITREEVKRAFYGSGEQAKGFNLENRPEVRQEGFIFTKRKNCTRNRRG